MKHVLMIAILIGGTFVQAQEAQKCAAQAEGMAQIVYLQKNRGIQGHEFTSKVTGYVYEAYDNSAAVEVTIDGRNDENEKWTQKYEVLLALDGCIYAQSSRK